MVRHSPGSVRRPEAWRCALFGGVTSMPLTAALYWVSGGGSEFSLDAVLVAGLVAGYLAAGRAVDADAAGLRAGAVGGLPGVAWLVPQIRGDVTALSGPAWFETAGVAFTVGVAALVLALAASFGLVGARVGGWVAERTGRQAGHAG